jgi:hypothetical protein
MDGWMNECQMRCRGQSPSGVLCDCEITRKELQLFENWLCVSCSHKIGLHAVPREPVATASASTAHSTVIDSPAVSGSASRLLLPNGLVCIQRSDACSKRVLSFIYLPSCVLVYQNSRQHL